MTGGTMVYGPSGTIALKGSWGILVPLDTSGIQRLGGAALGFTGTGTTAALRRR
jgi:hypothetical protein